MSTRILGILNITHDSHSDGGRYIDPGPALEHARAMRADGAARIDVGAESTHPDAEDVDADEEWRRLEPVLGALIAEGTEVSVDTTKPAVMRRALELGAQCINDVHALREPGAMEAVAVARCELVLMHSTAALARAERGVADVVDWIERITTFFSERLDTCTRAGIARERLILDPGMGFFLSSAARPSTIVLKRIEELRALGCPLCVSTSRKSFIGAVLDRPVGERGAGTLATELWCARAGVEWIRTHDVRALADALRMWRAIEEA